jgi:putative endonuclease
MDHAYFVYIITNKTHSTLYTGVTNNLTRRITEHIQGIGSSFTRRYKINKLVYFEVYPDIRSAISREKQIKAGSRIKKLELIHSLNPDWDDLFDNWQG